MKKFITTIFSFVTVLCITFSISGCFGNNKMSVSSESVKCEYVELLGWQVQVTGSITNTSGKDLSYISVEYKIYDSDNAVIGTAMDNANSIGKGETWKFEAMSFEFFDKKPEKVIFSKIQSVKDF